GGNSAICSLKSAICGGQDALRTAGGTPAQRNEKSLPLAREAFSGGGLRAFRSVVLNQLFRGRGLVLARRSRGSTSRSQRFQIVLQEANFDASTAGALGLGIFAGRRGHRSIAHANHIDPIDRNLVIEH